MFKALTGIVAAVTVGSMIAAVTPALPFVGFVWYVTSVVVTPLAVWGSSPIEE